MDIDPSGSPPDAVDETPEALLDRLHAHPDWTDRERDDALDRIVSRFPADAVVAAVQNRLQDLSGPDAEVLLRLVEANPRPALLRALGEAVVAQPDLSPERAWEALAVLDGAGVLADFPALADRWDELNEAFDESGSVDQLVEQLEDDPDGVWLALQGLAAVEPDVRAEIVAGLVSEGGPYGPGLTEFLRLLAYAHDPATRAAALDALADVASPGAWADLALHHPDPDVSAEARQRLGHAAQGLDRTGAGLPATTSGPGIVRSLVSAIDGEGRATVVLCAVHRGDHVTAVFECDVVAGVRDVFGDVSASSGTADASFDGYAGRIGREVVENDHVLAFGLLAGCLTLCGPDTPPALRYWVEATAGPDLRPRPFPAGAAGWDPAEVPFEEMTRRTADVLDACPDWLDDSPLTYELAEELALREGGSPVDPKRDAGAFRFLFEHRLRGQLERYRRMLLWMASFWSAGGRDELGRSALGLAWQLSDAQHVVPGHPFAVALSTRSLTAAREGLGRGVDPRKRGRGGRP